MSQSTWTAVDQYIAAALPSHDEALTAALAAAAAAGLPNIQVSAAQGRLLSLIAQMARAKRILEIGTLGGYSAICLARALPPDGRLITLELEARFAAVAQDNFARTGVADRVQVLIGPALDSLARLIAAKADPFDLIFIDADKPGYPAYFAEVLRLSRPGTVIIADNIVRDGALADRSSADPRVRGVQEFVALVGANPRLTSTVIQTVGEKGYDGFLLAVVA